MSDKMPFSAVDPDVSVVLIVYNDQDRILTAIDSVRNQTLSNLEIIVADDCSTDDTRQVVESAMVLDERIRYVRLDQNSGGCGAPRNAGIKAARAKWITFLDSDDEMERHACKNLLLTAEKTDAQVVAGHVVRRFVGSRQRSAWYPSLFRARKVLNSISEEPGRINDTLVVGKLFERSFLIENNITFDEDLHFEDLIFSMRVYTAFSRMAVVPETIYYWKVYGNEYRVSITNSTKELKNLRDRLLANRRLDEIIAHADIDGLKEVKDRKFLINDMTLYMYDVIEAGPSFAREVHKETHDYLELIDDRIYEDLPAQRRVPLALLRQGDYVGVQQAAFLAKGWGWFGSPVIINGMPYWDSPTLNDSLESKDLLNVSDIWDEERSFAELEIAATIEEVAAKGSVLTLKGQLGNPRDRIDVGRVNGVLRVANAKSRQVRSFPVTLSSSNQSGLINWETHADVGREAPFSDKWWQRFTLSLVLQSDDLTLTVLPKAVIEINDNLVVEAYTPYRRLVGDQMKLIVTANGDVRIRLDHSTPRHQKLGRKTVPYLQGRKAAKLRGTTRKWMREIEAKVWAGLPRKELAVFESHVGRSFSDSPRAIYEELLRRNTDLELLWSARDKDPSLPDSEHVLIRGTREYRRALGKAKYWIDNQGFPSNIDKPNSTTYVQTWHGIPLKHMGFDEPNLKKASPKEQHRVQKMIDRWDYLVCPSPYFEETFVDAFNVKATLIGPGTPRNDVLVNTKTVEQRDASKSALEISPSRQTILYAPTFREHQRAAKHAARVHLNLNKWSETIRDTGDDQSLLIRSHYMNRVEVPAHLSPRVRSVSSIGDTSALLTATDVLVTDYSSIMFDFACTGRPMIFYAFDFDLYSASARGVYFDIKEWAPGPFVETEEELLELVSTVNEWAPDFTDKYQSFVERFCAGEDGHATERLVSEVFSDYVEETT